MADSNHLRYLWAVAAGLNAALAAISASFFSSLFIKYGLVLFFNVTMWGCYVNSLKALSSLQATVTNFATNFLTSGLAGYFLFQEPLPYRLVLLVWSYFMVVFHDPGEVPVGWQPASKDNYLGLDVSVALTDHTSISTGEIEISSREGSEHRASIRYCSHCHNNKPARCHHCSVCQRCVLKMDHHCVWVVNCVGACNYKFFLLFLLYTFLETVLDSLALLPHFIKFFGDARNHSGSPGSLAVTFLSFVLNVAFALSLLCFVIMHTSLVLSNTTTIEVHEKKNMGEWKYDLGKRKNFEQVFGTNKLFWFIPLFSKSDLFNVPALRGLDFPTRSESEMEV